MDLIKEISQPGHCLILPPCLCLGNLEGNNDVWDYDDDNTDVNDDKTSSWLSTSRTLNLSSRTSASVSTLVGNIMSNVMMIVMTMRTLMMMLMIIMLTIIHLGNILMMIMTMMTAMMILMITMLTILHLFQLCSQASLPLPTLKQWAQKPHWAPDVTCKFYSVFLMLTYVTEVYIYRSSVFILWNMRFYFTFHQLPPHPPAPNKKWWRW